MIDQMNVTKLKELLDNNEDILLIDCREQDEWDQGHIAQAAFKPLSNFPEEINKMGDIAKDKTIVCQCRSGKRSLQAAMALQGEGFEKLYNLEGGILAWQESNFPIQS